MKNLNDYFVSQTIKNKFRNQLHNSCWNQIWEQTDQGFAHKLWMNILNQMINRLEFELEKKLIDSLNPLDIHNKV